MKYTKIYLDMDGLLVDFHSHFQTLFGMSFKEYKKEYGIKRTFEKISMRVDFFRSAPKMAHCDDILAMAYRLAEEVSILSAPCPINGQMSILHKRQWIDNNLSEGLPAIFDEVKYKYSGSSRILIDDTQEHIEMWIHEGGLGFLYKDNYDELKRWMLGLAEQGEPCHTSKN